MFVTFRIVLSLILLAIQYYFFRNLASYLRKRPNTSLRRRLTIVFFGIFSIPLIIMLFWPIPLQYLPNWFVLAAVYPFYVWHFSSFVLFLIVMLGKILKLPYISMVWLMSKSVRTKRWVHAIRARQEAKYNAERRVFLQRGLTIIAGTAVAGSAYGAFRRNHFELTEISIPIKNLPRQFEGFTIALVSDIHSSVFMMKEQMQHYVENVNALGADMIAVTGDFVNSMLEEVYPFAEAFSVLKAPSGVYGVLGNHDYYTRRVDLVAKEVNDCGIKLLRNERIEIRKGMSAIHLLGVDDIGSTQRAALYFDKTLQGADPATTKLLLCHRPYFFEQAADRNIDLTLSGHTHGGQIVFARIGKDVFAPARIASPYVAGLYTMADSKMYVSRGIGTVGVPIRINCPAEITKITLVRS